MKKHIVFWFFITIVAMGFGTAYGQVSPGQLQIQASELANAEAAKYIVQCGETWFGGRTNPIWQRGVTEMKRWIGPTIEVRVLSEAEKLNGFEWRGIIRYHSDGPIRRYISFEWNDPTPNINNNKWSDWEMTGMDIKISVQRKNGQWFVSATDVFGVLWAEGFSCSQLPGAMADLLPSDPTGQLVNILSKAERNANEGKSTPADIDISKVKQLISKGANVNASRKDPDGISAPILVSAIASGRPDLVSLLLDKGANVNINARIALPNSSHTETPIYRAKGIKMVQLLVDKGADLNARGHGGDTLLFNSFYSDTKLLEFYLSKGVDINAKSDGGATVLSAAEGRRESNLIDIARFEKFIAEKSSGEVGHSYGNRDRIKEEQKIIDKSIGILLKHGAVDPIKQRYNLFCKAERNTIESESTPSQLQADKFIGTWTSNDENPKLEICFHDNKYLFKGRGMYNIGTYKNGKIVAEGREGDFYKAQIPTLELLESGELLLDCGACGPDKLKKSNNAQPQVNEETTKILATVEQRLKNLPAPPEYLYKTDSFTGAVASTWVEMTSGILGTKGLREKYEEFYLSAVDYRGLAQMQLIRAKRVAKQGDVQTARHFLKSADHYLKLSNLSSQGAAQVYLGNIDAAAEFARGIYEGSKKSVSFGAVALGPAGSRAVDIVFTATDFAVRATDVGLSEAAKETFVKLLTEAAIKNVPISSLGGKSLSDVITKTTTKAIGSSQVYGILKSASSSPEFSKAVTTLLAKSAARELNRLAKDQVARVILVLASENPISSPVSDSRTTQRLAEAQARSTVARQDISSSNVVGEGGVQNRVTLFRVAIG